MQMFRRDSNHLEVKQSTPLLIDCSIPVLRELSRPSLSVPELSSIGGDLTSMEDASRRRIDALTLGR